MSSIFDVIQSWFGAFFVCFIVLNACLDVIEPRVYINVIFVCLLCVNWVVFSWRERAEENREIACLPVEWQQKIYLPRWVTVFHYMYPFLLLVPICAVVLGRYVFVELHVSPYCLWVSLLSLLMSIIITGKYDEYNENVLERYRLLFSQGEECSYG